MLWILNCGVLFFYYYYFFIEVDFVIHWDETAMGLHVFPIPIPPPTSLSTPFRWLLTFCLGGKCLSSYFKPHFRGGHFARRGRGESKHSTCLECGFLSFHNLHVCLGGLVWGLINIKWKLTYLLSRYYRHCSPLSLVVTLKRAMELRTKLCQGFRHSSLLLINHCIKSVLTFP